MSNIKLAFTQLGQILGDFTETHEGWAVDNPVVVSAGPQGVQMLPLLMLAESTRITLTPGDFMLNAELFDPKDELRNHYSSQFGSGIQLLT